MEGPTQGDTPLMVIQVMLFFQMMVLLTLIQVQAPNIFLGIAGQKPWDMKAQVERHLVQLSFESPVLEIVRDYAPLSSMRSQSTATPVGHSPPRKKREDDEQARKGDEASVLQGHSMTRVFVTGPLDPVHNKYKF